MKRDAIERLLPTMYQLSARPGSPLDALLFVMDDLHERDERLLAEIDAVFDPYRAPGPFVPWLTQWLGLEWLVAVGADADLFPGFEPGIGRLHDVVSVGATLAQWRGTEAGLVLFLSAATGVAGFAVDEPPDRPFHLVVTVPPEAAPYAALVQRIVEREKPAYATAEVRLASAAGSDADAIADRDADRDADREGGPS